MPSLEVVMMRGTRPDVERMLGAFHAAAKYAGLSSRQVEVPSGRAAWLALYGAGRPEVRDMLEVQVARGGHALVFDLGYWNRMSFLRSWRIAIDALHPSAADLARTTPAPSRMFALREAIQETRPPCEIRRVLIAGVGPKTRAGFGMHDFAWERAALERVKTHFPQAEVFYRTKPGHAPEDLPGTTPMHGGDISRVLRRIDLAVCWRSNVAVDCAIAGVPCVAEGGVGAVLYGNDMAALRYPTKQERVDFLHRVACWQWDRSEAYECWKFVLAHVRAGAA
jgi:hypothetical protein